MRYSVEVIKVLLNTKGFTEGFDVSSPTHRYYLANQAVTEETLWNDLWNYVCAQKGKVQERSVIFFIETQPSHYVAAFLQFSKVNPEAESNWLKWFTKESQTSQPSAKTLSGRKILSSFYGDVEGRFLGDKQTLAPEIKRLNKNLAAVYSSARRQVQVTYIDSAKNPDVVLMEYLLQLSDKKPVKELNIPEIIASHYVISREFFCSWWKEIQQTQPAIFIQLKDLILRLSKYNLLQLQRERYKEGMEKANYEQLNELLSYDRMQKMQIYQKEISDVFTVVKELPFLTIVALLPYRETKNISGLIQLLQDECQKQQEQIKAWEKNLIQTTANRRWLSTEIAHFVKSQLWQYSFIGVGEQVVPFLGEVGLRWVRWGVKKILPTTVRSPWQWSKKFLPTQDSWSVIEKSFPATSVESLVQIFQGSGLKWGGRVLGAYCTYVGGIYFLTKSVVIGNSSYYIHRKLQDQIDIDDETATVKLQSPWSWVKKILPTTVRSPWQWSKKFLPTQDSWSAIEKSLPTSTVISLSQMFQVGAALGESVLERSFYPLVEVVGGIGGSMWSVERGKKFFTGQLIRRANTHKKLLQNDPVLQDPDKFLLSCSLGGHITGSLFFGLSYRGIAKAITRVELSNEFCNLVEEGNYRDCVVDFSKTPTWSSDFWTQKTDSVRLGCRDTEHTSLEAYCRVIPDPKAYNVSCPRPIFHVANRLQ